MANVFIRIFLLCVLHPSASALGVVDDEISPLGLDQVSCVYHISGQYGLLPRYLYYALLIFAIFTRRSDWLAAGALVSILTYAGTATVHAFVLAVISSNSQLDLDTVGALVICNAGFLAVPCLLNWSSTLRESVVRSSVGYCGSFVSLGAICASVALIRPHYAERECYSRTGALLTSKSQLDVTFNCTYRGFATRQPLRSPSEIVAVPLSRVGSWNHSYGVDFLIIMAMVFGAVGIFLSWWTARDLKKRTEPELLDLVAIEEGREPRNEIERTRRDFVLKRLRKELETGVDRRNEINRLGVLALLIAWAGTIIFGEVYPLAGGGLPTTEQPYHVGQWSPLVGAILALIGATFVHFHEPKWRELKGIAVREQENIRLRTGGTPPSMVSNTTEPEQGVIAGGLTVRNAQNTRLETRNSLETSSIVQGEGTQTNICQHDHNFQTPSANDTSYVEKYAGFYHP